MSDGYARFVKQCTSSDTRIQKVKMQNEGTHVVEEH